MQHKLWHNGHEVESTPLKKFFFKAGFFELLLYLCILVHTVATNYVIIAICAQISCILHNKPAYLHPWWILPSASGLYI